MFPECPSKPFFMCSALSLPEILYKFLLITETVAIKYAVIWIKNNHY